MGGKKIALQITLMKLSWKIRLQRSIIKGQQRVLYKLLQLNCYNQCTDAAEINPPKQKETVLHDLTDITGPSSKSFFHLYRKCLVVITKVVNI